MPKRLPTFQKEYSNLAGSLFVYGPSMASIPFSLAWFLDLKDLTHGGIGNLPASLSLMSASLGARFIAGFINGVIGENNYFATPDICDGQYASESEAVFHGAVVTIGTCLMVSSMFVNDGITLAMVGVVIAYTHGLAMGGGVISHKLGQTAGEKWVETTSSCCGYLAETFAGWTRSIRGVQPIAGNDGAELRPFSTSSLIPSN